MSRETLEEIASEVKDLAETITHSTEQEIKKMNFLSVLSGIFKLIPYVVAGINVIHTNESTETKTQLAQDALSVATQGAVSLLGPGTNENIATAVASAVNAGIVSVQGVQSALNNAPEVQLNGQITKLAAPVGR